MSTRANDDRTSLLRRLGESVRQRRTERALTHAELGRRAGVSVRFLGELEAGRGNISVGRLHDLAVALGTTAAALLEGETGGARAKLIGLLGLRGAGKSTIGPRLAKRLRMPFFELDSVVERAAGLPLAELFELHGEGRYRELSRSELRALLTAHGKHGAVIATGGGLVMDDEAFAMLRAETTSVWLSASPRSHWDRVVAQGDRRPMHNRKDAQAELAALLRVRHERYARAALTIDTDALGIDGAVEAIARAVGASTHSH
jgi:XRE family aerobic/anaerobic benzoate catabolism transcriptional regulator